MCCSLFVSRHRISSVIWDMCPLISCKCSTAATSYMLRFSSVSVDSGCGRRRAGNVEIPALMFSKSLCSSGRRLLPVSPYSVASVAIESLSYGFNLSSFQVFPVGTNCCLSARETISLLLQ